MKQLIPLVLIGILSACSNSPSETEAKAVVLNAINDCKRLSLESFKKTNGVAEGNNKYTVSFEYVLKVLPPENGADFEKTNSSISERIMQELSAAKSDLAHAEQNKNEISESIKTFENESRSLSASAGKEAAEAASYAQANHCKYDSDCAKKSQQILVEQNKVGTARAAEKAVLIEKRDKATATFDAAETKVRNLEANLASISLLPMSSFAKDCSGVDVSIRRLIGQGADDFEKSNPGKNAYLNGFSAKFQGTAILIKTDNGWKTGL